MIGAHLKPPVMGWLLWPFVDLACSFDWLAHKNYADYASGSIAMTFMDFQ